MRSVAPTLLRLADGRLLWCGYDATARTDEVLLAALAGDEGRTWYPPRELLRLPRAAAEAMDQEAASTGLSFNQVVELSNGQLLVAAGHHADTRRLLRVSAAWLAGG